MYALSHQDDSLTLQKLKKSLDLFQSSDRKLGQGAYGSVYKVRYENTDMAMKIVKKEDQWLPGDPMTDAEHEIKMMNSLGMQQNLIYLYASFTRGKVYEKSPTFMFMEFAAKGDLFKDIVHRKTYSESQAKMFIYQIVNGLAFISKKIRKIKISIPENTLIF